MPDRSHLSIGEVLSLLRDEFPDVTISKIRFLESQGLVDPERTPSGYRKFYEHDVERLRWILRQQRENFLPLKVIKGRLTDQDDDESGGLDATELELNGSGVSPEGIPVGPDAAAHADPTPVAAGAPSPGPAARGEQTVGGASSRGPTGPVGLSAPPAERAVEPVAPGPGRAGPGEPTPSHGADRPLSPARPGPAVEAVPADARPSLPATDENDSFTLDELLTRSGLDKAQVDELSRFGLISPISSSGGERYYDADAVAVATVAAGFAHHGVEARHLRGWRTSAEREVSLFEQVVVPLLRQRNPQARNQAAVTLDELADLGASLREVLIRRAIRDVH